MEKFTKLGLGKALVETLSNFQITNPTPIQEKTIPLIASGQDVIGQAATGSGKTLAFSSVIIEKVQTGKGIQALILTPTRELAEQVMREIQKYSKGYNLRITSVYGGVSINPQIRDLEKTEIVVGTPGRILDHLDRRTLNLKNLSFLVLDEADRMVDMGFLRDVEKIISLCPQKKQMFLFSATLTPDINYISKKYMNHPKTITVESYVDPSKLRQIFYDLPSHEKFSLLAHLLKSEKSNLTMVFCNTRRTAEMLSSNLKNFKIKALSTHGGLSQMKRNKLVEDFHKQHFNILICTDVAARGLHIANVSHVYNYDIPSSSKDYIHRIGRTARVGKEGEAISLVSNNDYQNFRKVLEDKSLKIEQKPLPDFEKLKPMFRHTVRDETRRYGDRGDGRRSFGRGSRTYGRDSSYRSGGDNRGRPMRSSGGFDRPRRDFHPGQRRDFSSRRSFGRR
ncbi:DEAD/DEAH box helicase [Candidatus Pacearchaeota archaeon]|nr:DEAD/DEAH box helicase [Candidatus Pacearchaeota archaeon]